MLVGCLFDEFDHVSVLVRKIFFVDRPENGVNRFDDGFSESATCHAPCRAASREHCDSARVSWHAHGRPRQTGKVLHHRVTNG